MRNGNRLIVGVDIGNSTTEAALAEVSNSGNKRFLASSATKTTGLKGTLANVEGVLTALQKVMKSANIDNFHEIDKILLNETAPTLCGTALETVSQTIVTDSAIIGHNPRTPAGMGVAAGTLRRVDRLPQASDQQVIATAPAEFTYETVANLINMAKCNVTGLILQKDEAVLVYNRLSRKICIVDEVCRIDKLEDGAFAAIEVAPPATTLRALCDPYGLASLLSLTPEETKQVTPTAKSFVGKRSGVVVKSEGKSFAGVAENVMKAGKLTFLARENVEIEVDSGAETIMKTLSNIGVIDDVSGQKNTHIGKMIDDIKDQVSLLYDNETHQSTISDIFIADTYTHVPIDGALAGEIRSEKAVAIAATARTDASPTLRIAKALTEKTGINSVVAGAEAIMAALGAITTPGASLPLAMLDLGAGTTDAAVLAASGEIRHVCLAGAGDLVTTLIKTELNIYEKSVAELIKRHPVGKAESLSHIRMENGNVTFFDKPLPPKMYNATVILAENEIIPLEFDISVEKIVQTRREAKEKVFAENALRAVKKLSNGDKLPFVVLVGGSSEDFEIPTLLMKTFDKIGVTCGRGNIRSLCGPRNAVATGLVMNFTEGF